MRLEKLRPLGVPCPRWLMPRIVARETGQDGRIHFEVEAHVPVLGRVAGYRGHLDMPREVPA